MSPREPANRLQCPKAARERAHVGHWWDRVAGGRFWCAGFPRVELPGPDFSRPGRGLHLQVPAPEGSRLMEDVRTVEDVELPEEPPARVPEFRPGVYRHVQDGSLINALGLALDTRFRARVLVLYFPISPAQPGPMARVRDLETFRGAYAWRGQHPTEEMLGR